MNEPENLEIARINPDGTMEVLLHEPHHVEFLARTLFSLKAENDQLRRLLEETVKDTDRLDSDMITLMIRDEKVTLRDIDLRERIDEARRENP